jgi:hypothetical protein
VSSLLVVAGLNFPGMPDNELTPASVAFTIFSLLEHRRLGSLSDSLSQG